MSQPHIPKSTARRARTVQERTRTIPVWRAIKPRTYGSTKQVVGEAFRQAGGVKEVAALFDLGETQVYGFTDPDAKGSEISLHRARQLAYVKKVTAFAEDFAAIAGGVFLAPDIVDNGECIADIGGDIVKRVADMVAEILSAIQDGTLSDQECIDIRRRVDHALAVLVALRARLMERCPP